MNIITELSLSDSQNGSTLECCRCRKGQELVQVLLSVMCSMVRELFHHHPPDEITRQHHLRHVLDGERIFSSLHIREAAGPDPKSEHFGLVHDHGCVFRVYKTCGGPTRG